MLRRKGPALFVLIGVLGAAAQPLPGQERSQIGALGGKDGGFRERFAELLLRDPPLRDDVEDGLALAHDLGRPAVPLLWEMLLAEKSNVQRRITLLVAVFAASGVGEDERLWRWLEERPHDPRERVMACLLLALGPDRRPVPGGFWPHVFGRGGEPEDILRVAALLAAPRIPDALKTAPVRPDTDVGLLAAAAYGRLPIPRSAEERLWNLRDPERHAELLWRATLLGRLLGGGEPKNSVLQERARKVAELSDTFAAARESSALYRSRIGDVTPTGVRPHWEVLQLLAAEPATAVKLQPWLTPSPPPSDDGKRLAVEYVLSRRVDEVVADVPKWSGDPRIRSDVAIALAMRVLDADPGAVQPITASVPAVPEWFFVRWASGAAPAVRDAEIAGDPVLERAADLAFDGRLPRAVARDVLEEALWRRESHPGLGLWHAQRALVRDLLLRGSHPGMRWLSHVPLEQRYQPAGFGPDDLFFQIAVLAYEFFSRPRLPIPNECRLR